MKKEASASFFIFKIKTYNHLWLILLKCDYKLTKTHELTYIIAFLSCFVTTKLC
ncbi:hypothetical protein THF1C08_220063 [Vibrio jasicida]|uniref:Uncharacterized protein n=1 Tax=Vibrio jasicida TaxID=766224 RepID=A0AAU9QS79_9VIBR|nr:hypothetical protein THF1C08_220063 [Vibrio jasicida]CAH1598091.1 hypothetical protein THF1A12_340065 [Vibrio jasicida]CAH1605172.1 hypothetical protein THF5G08_120037 [Vibrio jasicida]